MRRHTRFVAALAVLAWGLGLPASAAPVPCGPGGLTEDVGGGWIASQPQFTAGPPAITLLASPAFDPNLVYATNGSVLMRSDDAGCGWKVVYAASSGAGALPGTTAAITALAAPSSATSTRAVYVGLTRTTLLGVTTPAVVASSDRGGTFVLHDSGAGLPLAGSVVELTANPQVPLVAYAVVDGGLLGAGRALFATTDGGASWTQRTPTGASFAGTRLLTHPTTQTTVFALDGGAVVRSTDGGATFTRTSPSGTVTDLQGAAGNGSVRLAAAVAGSRAVHVSTDLGATWLPFASPVAPLAVAPAPLQGILAASDAEDTYLLLPTPRRVTPTGGAPTSLSLTAPTRLGFALTGLRGGAMLRLTVDGAGVALPVIGSRPVLLLPPGIVTQFPSVFLPTGLRVSLPAGARVVVPHQLLVPRTPTPVDVLFLIDSTGSMDTVINDLRAGVGDIANALGRNGAGLDVQIGVGDFRDYPAPRGPASPGDWAWRLRLGISPLGDGRLEAALNNTTTGGGTSDGLTSAWAALYQSSTGEDLVDGAVTAVPGTRAGYRVGSLRLAMLASDAPAHEGGSAYSAGNGQQVVEPGPAPDQSLRALRANGVHVIGLSVPGGGSGDPTPYLKDAAGGSRTFAPPGGVDCDGNGTVDLVQGAPLVCPLASGTRTDLGVVRIDSNQGGTASGLTAAVVGLAAGIPDVRPVEVQVTRGQAYAALQGDARRALNLRADNELAFGLALSCPAGRSTTQRIDLSGQSLGRTLATSSIELVCSSAPVAAVPPAGVPPVPQVEPRAEVVAPPPAPGQPAPNPNPNPNPGPNVNPAANVNANPGAAQQEQTTPQLAFAENNGSDQLAMSLAMSWAFVTVAGLLTCTAGGLALRRRGAAQDA